MSYFTKLCNTAEAHNAALRFYRSLGWNDDAPATWGIEISVRREGTRIEVVVEDAASLESAAEQALAKWKGASRGLPALAPPR